MELDIRDIGTETASANRRGGKNPEVGRRTDPWARQESPNTCRFQNYRRRIEQWRQQNCRGRQTRDAASFARYHRRHGKALQFAEESEQPSVKGVRIIHKKFLALLEKQGILPFISVGTSVQAMNCHWKAVGNGETRRQRTGNCSWLNSAAATSGTMHYFAMRRYESQNDRRGDNRGHSG